MASAVSPIETKFGVEADESDDNHRDKDCKDICKACDDSSKTMSGEAPRIGGVDDWVSWLTCGYCFTQGIEGRMAGWEGNCSLGAWAELGEIDGVLNKVNVSRPVESVTVVYIFSQMTHCFLGSLSLPDFGGRTRGIP